MGAVGTRRQRSFARHIASRGEDTLVNGATVTALWQDAETNRVHTFLNEDEWSKSSFEVRFDGTVAGLRNGLEVVRDPSGLNWRCVMRQVTPEVSNGTTIQWNCLAVLATD